MPDSVKFAFNRINSIGRMAYTIDPMGILTILLLLLSFTSFAQSKKDIYGKAVDQMNFATMQFVLAADTSKPEAVALSEGLNKLNLNYNQLQEKIIEVYGPNSRTQDLSIKINRHKDKFSATKPLSAQLESVAGFIKTDRKDKVYLQELIAELEVIQENASAAVIEEEQTVANTNNQIPASATTLSSMNTTQATGTPTLLIIAIILIGILSLFNLWLYYKLSKSRRGAHGSGGDGYSTARQAIDFEIYPRLEKNTVSLEKKIEALREEMLQLLVEKKEQEKPRVIAEQKLSERNAVPPVSTPTPTSTPAPTPAVVTPGNVIELSVNKPPQQEKPRTVKKYADYPQENGFVMSQLNDTSDRRSIYEITIPPDSDYASFTVVNDKAIHEYAIQNRERLLKDACDFEVSSSRHTQINVEAPGKLQKNGNTWQILTKAKIRFV